MAVVITDDTLAALGMTEDNFRRELAIFFFREGKLTLSRAARLAAMPRISFQKLLASRQIPIHYDAGDLHKDLETLQDAGLL
jgi:predicted HTH domain antitoxin